MFGRFVSTMHAGNLLFSPFFMLFGSKMVFHFACIVHYLGEIADWRLDVLGSNAKVSKLDI